MSKQNGECCCVDPLAMAVSLSGPPPPPHHTAIAPTTDSKTAEADLKCVPVVTTDARTPGISISVEKPAPSCR